MKDNPKRDTILQAGSECFARFGYDKTTLDDIGKRAGLNKASLYYYFKNKEEIFIAVVLAETQAFIAELQEKARQRAAVREQLGFYLTERIRRYGEVLHLTRLSIDNLQKLEPLFDAVYAETKSNEVTFLTELLENARLDLPLSPAETADTLFHVSDAVKHETVRLSGRFAPGELDFQPAIERMERVLTLIFR